MKAWLAIVIVGVGTFAIRASFLYLYDYLDLSPTAERALELVPAAVLSALVAPGVLVPEGSVVVLDPRPLAAAVAVAVAWYTEDILATIVAGLAVLLAIQGLPP
jgi:branched-subunit amino acid transport protein